MVEQFKNYGIYDFNKFTRIDPFAGDNIIYTRIHELVHLNLTTNTMFGLTNYVIDQLSWNTKEKHIPLEKISEKLIKSSRKVHEATAVFYQYAAIKQIEGEDSYNKAIKKLKEENKEYYKYVEELLFLLDNYRLKDVLSSELIFRLANIALNCDITNLPENIIKKANKTWNYFTHPSKGKDFNPNTRFRKLVKTLKELLVHYELNDITDELLLEKSELRNTILGEIHLKELVNWLYKEFRTPATEVKLMEFLEISETEGSEGNDSTENVDDEYWHLVHPTPLNARYKNIQIELSKLEFKEICAVHIVPLEMSKVALVAVDVKEGINYTEVMSEELASEFLSNCKKKIIISHEYYELLKKDSDLNVFLNNNFFVYVEIPYIKSSKFIEENISDKKEIMLTKFGENLYHIIIKMKDDNGVIIIPLFDSSLKIIAEEIKSKKYIPINDFKKSVFFKGNLCPFCYEDIICATSLIKYWGRDRVTFISIVKE